MLGCTEVLHDFVLIVVSVLLCFSLDHLRNSNIKVFEKLDILKLIILFHTLIGDLNKQRMKLKFEMEIDQWINWSKYSWCIFSWIKWTKFLLCIDLWIAWSKYFQFIDHKSYDQCICYVSTNESHDETVKYRISKCIDHGVEFH